MNRSYLSTLAIALVLLAFLSFLPGTVASAQPPCDRYKIQSSVDGYKARFSVSNVHELKGVISWDLGDGSSGYEYGESHTYSASGPKSYTVKAIIYRIWYTPCHVSTTIKLPGRASAGDVSSQDDKTEAGEAVGKANPPVLTCPYLPVSIRVSGYGPQTQCRQLDAGGVGVSELIAQGIIDAVDIFGGVDGSVQVCFRGRGQLKFLDASSAPRAQSDLAAENVNGLTCGRIDRPGTVVLLQGAESQAGGSGETIAVAPPEPSAGAVLVHNCRLTTTDHLSLRAGPSIFYIRLDIIPIRTRLTATARTGNWFLVEFDELKGWVNSEYVTSSAACDDAGEAVGIFLAIRTPARSTEPEEPEQREDSEATAITVPDAQPLIFCSLRAGDIINLRRGPGLEYDILAEIPYRTNLIATERSGEWFQVEYNDIIGWVHIDYVFRNGACG